VYMGAGDALHVRDALVEAGKAPATPIAIVENASLPDERITYATLARLPAAARTRGRGPALSLLGPPFAAAAAAQHERGSATG
jgi:siroheme synthase